MAWTEDIIKNDQMARLAPASPVLDQVCSDILHRLVGERINQCSTDGGDALRALQALRRFGHNYAELRTLPDDEWLAMAGFYSTEGGFRCTMAPTPELAVARLVLTLHVAGHFDNIPPARRATGG